MSIIIRNLLLILIVTSISSFASETTPGPAQSGTYAAPQEPHRDQRRAILDVLRAAIKQREGRDVVFVVRDLAVSNGWAWLHAATQSADGKHRYGDVSGLLAQRDESWHLLEVQCSDAGDPTCIARADFYQDLKKRFPAVPAALVTAAGAQIDSTTEVITEMHSSSLPVSGGEGIEFDRDFRGLLEKSQTVTDLTPTRAQLHEQLALTQSTLQAMTNVVRQLQAYRQESIAKQTQLHNELDSQREATAQAHSAHRALASELSGLRDRVFELTDSIETIRANQPTADPQLSDLRETLTHQQDAAQRFDSDIAAIRSDMAAIHTQLNNLSSAQQQIRDAAAGARRQFVENESKIATQLEALDDSLQELRTGRDNIVTELDKINDELKAGGQTLAQSQAANEARLAELATKQNLDDLAVAQQQLKNDDTVAIEKLQQLEKSLRELHTGRNATVTALAEIRNELQAQAQTLAQSQAANEARLTELATKQNLDDLAVAQQQLKNDDTVAIEKLQQMEKSLQELHNSGQQLTSGLSRLGRQFDSRRGADMQTDADRAKILDDLAQLQSKMAAADETRRSDRAQRERLISELGVLKQKFARHGEYFAESGSEIAAIQSEVAAIGDELEDLRKAQQATDGQTAQQRATLKQELNSAREQIAVIANSLPSASSRMQHLVSGLAEKMEQELETHRRQITQSELNRRKLVSEVLDVRDRLTTLDQAERAARISRTRLSAEISALRKQITDAYDASPTAVARLDSGPASVRSDDQRDPGTASHPPGPGKQTGSRGSWKITPNPENYAGRTNHKAPGAITRSPTRADPRDAPDGAELTVAKTPAIIGAITRPAGSSEPKQGPQVASAGNVSTFTDLNSFSDFDAIDPFLQAWTEDWERKDLEAYLAHYSHKFQPSGGINLDTWRDQRRNSLLSPAFIDVKINNIQKKPTSASSAQLTFNQSYRSNIYSDEVSKTLYLRWEDERWKIVREESRSID